MDEWIPFLVFKGKPKRSRTCSRPVNRPIRHIGCEESSVSGLLTGLELMGDSKILITPTFKDVDLFLYQSSAVS